MPRKPKLAKHEIVVRVNDTPIAVHLHPPTGRRTSWYAFWNGLETSRSTGQSDLAKAIEAAEHMVKNQSSRPVLDHAVLSDDEFETIQRHYFARRKDPDAKKRADKTLDDCLEAIDAFRRVSSLRPITLATADDCAAFQRQALTLPNNWRKQHPNSRKEVNCISVNTVLKWSRQLQAAWNRANRNAGRKCVRGVIDAAKLLTDNPWLHFTWLEGTDRPIRQLDADELVSVLDYFSRQWSCVAVATLLAKTLLWSWTRREEVTELRWASLRCVGGERHFEAIGKHGVEKWFRIPEGLYQELLACRTDSEYVFAAYAEQLRRFHEQNERHREAGMVGPEFKPTNLANWFHNRLKKWSTSLPKGKVTMHIFRKTTMQYARAGEDINQRVAVDICVSPDVMMTHYVKETDEQMRQKSNRTYQRIVAALPPAVAARYGHVTDATSELEEKAMEAAAAGNWELAARLSAKLARLKAAAS
jgi:integrase